MRVTVSRKAHFNAAHRLYRKDWSDEKNNSSSVGQKILHEKYGEGVIKEVQGNEITVEFSDDIGTKYLDIEWAPIKFL